MKKLTGFAVLWVTTFIMLWILDENDLFSYRTIEIFFGEELPLPKEYPTKKIDLSEMGKKRDILEVEEYIPPVIKQELKQKMPPKKISVQEEKPKLQESIKKQEIPPHILSLYKQGDFYNCLYNIEKEKESLQKEYSKEELNMVEKKCKNLMLLVEGVPRKKKFRGQVFMLIMKNGREYIGKIVANSLNTIDFQSSWGTIQIPKNRMVSQKEFDYDAHRSQLSKKLKKNIRSLSIKNYSSILALFKESYQNNMDYLIPMTISFLERKDSNIIFDLVEYKASRIYQSYLWCQAMGQNNRAQIFRNKILDSYPKSKAAKQIRKTKEIQKIAVAPKKEIRKKNLPSAKGSTAQIVSKANSYYSVGFKHLKKSFPGEPNSDKELAKAKENFQKACKYYQEALSLQPNNKNLEKQLQQSMEYYHHCIKQTRLK